MSRTSLGQKNEQQLRRNMGSNIKQVTSVVRSQDRGQERVFNLQDEEANLFKYMRDKYQKTERETRYINCEPGQNYSFIKDDFGKYIFQNGDQYIGEWKSQKMQGRGKYTFCQSGKVYLGQFAAGLFHGFGTLIQSQEGYGNILYQGEWEQGVKHGQGTHYYQNGVKYTGDWKNNRKEGQGTVSLPSGQYTGKWMGDQRHGQGKLTKHQKNMIIIYEGLWDNDQLHEGTINYYQNDYYNNSKNTFVGKYQGHLQNGKKHGWGHYYWPSHQNRTQLGIEYDGMFFQDKIRGKGKIVIGNTKFDGQFYSEDDTFGGPELKGNISYENGDNFEGIVSIKNGAVRREKGTYFFQNGDRADGQFFDNDTGQLRGKFLYEWTSGKTKQFG